MKNSSQSKTSSQGDKNHDIASLIKGAYVTANDGTEWRTSDNRLLLSGAVVQQIQDIANNELTSGIEKELNYPTAHADVQSARVREEFSRELVLEMLSARDELNPSFFRAVLEANASLAVESGFEALEMARQALESDDVDMKRAAVFQLAQSTFQIDAAQSTHTLQTSQAAKLLEYNQTNLEKATAINGGLSILADIFEYKRYSPEELRHAIAALNQAFPDEGASISEKIIDAAAALEQLANGQVSEDVLMEKLENAHSALDEKLDESLAAATHQYRYDESFQEMYEKQKTHTDNMMESIMAVGGIERARDIVDLLKEDNPYLAATSVDAEMQGDHLSASESDLELDAD